MLEILLKVMPLTLLAQPALNKKLRIDRAHLVLSTFACMKKNSLMVLKTLAHLKVLAFPLFINFWRSISYYTLIPDEHKDF